MSNWIPASAIGLITAATVPGLSAMPVSVIRASFRSAAMPAMRFLSISAPESSATISVPGLSSNADRTRKGKFSRIASPTERTCSTLAPTPASSSISSNVTWLSLLAFGTMRGSVV